MADYEDLDDASLQQKLSDATSYEERAALRQVLRKRKKERGETVVRSKARGNSVYNRFAGSTAKSSKSGPAVLKSIPAGDKPVKQESSVKKKESPIQQSTTPTSATPTSATPTKSPTPPVTPDPQPDLQPDPQPDPQPDQPQPCEEESDAAQVAVVPDEEKDVPKEDVSAETEEEVADETSPASEEVPKEGHNDDNDDDEAALGIQEKSAPSEEHDAQSTKPHDDTDSVKPEQQEPVELQQYLVAYVNQELFLDPPIPVRGKALYDTCSDPTSLCKLINKAVPGTVDMRALSKVSGSTSQRAEAKNDNMTLVVESARAIGCRINDATTLDGLLNKDPETINDFLLDLIRAQVVHMPGMEDEPASTFTDLPTLFEKLHISIESDQKPVSWRDDPEKIQKAKALQDSSPGTKGSWRDAKADSTSLTYEERAALRKAEREQRQKEKEAEVNSVGLTYEERAAQRKAERERRRKEREALAK